MTTSLRRISNHIRVISTFAVVQLMAQVAGWIAVLVFVRVLDKRDYGLYVLTASATTIIFGISDGGIPDAVTAIGGRAWESSAHLGRVVASALRVRRRLFAAILAPVLLVEGFLFAQRGTGAAEMMFLLGIATVSATWRALAEIYKAPLQLKNGFARLQRIDFSAALLRSVLALALVDFLDVNVAVLIVLAGVLLQFVAIWRSLRRDADVHAVPDSEVEAQIRKIVRRQWPYDAVTVFHGQIFIMLLAAFGSAAGVANVGALGLFAVGYAVLWTTMRSIVLPGFARTGDGLRRRYWLIVSGAVVVSLLVLGFIVAASGLLLKLLGEKYQHLEYLLFLVTLTNSIGFLVNVTWGLNSFRGWVIPWWLMIPIELGSLVAFTLALGVGSTERILLAGTLSAVVMLLVNVVGTVFFSGWYRGLESEGDRDPLMGATAT